MTKATTSAFAHNSAMATAKLLALTAYDLLTNLALVEAERADIAERTT